MLEEHYLGSGCQNQDQSEWVPHYFSFCEVSAFMQTTYIFQTTITAKRCIV